MIISDDADIKPHLTLLYLLFRVCDIAQRSTDLYTIGTAGLIVGTAFFSWFADWKGRRPAFFVSVALVMIFQLAKLGLADNYLGYLIVKVRR